MIHWLKLSAWKELEFHIPIKLTFSQTDRGCVRAVGNLYGWALGNLHGYTTGIQVLMPCIPKRLSTVQNCPHQKINYLRNGELLITIMTIKTGNIYTSKLQMESKVFTSFLDSQVIT